MKRKKTFRNYKPFLAICGLVVAFFSIYLFRAAPCIADEPPSNLEYWKKIINGNVPLERSPGEDWELAQRVKTFNEFDGKQILSFIRQGDYTHAGEEEAIDLMMSTFSKDEKRRILDVACGLGGTAEYIRKHGWGVVVGFDIEEEAILYAKSTYPQVDFFVADVADVAKEIKTPDFDLICIVNSFVCFPDQSRCLKELRKLAKPSTNLVILDYTDLIEKNENPLTGSGKSVSFRPIKPKEIAAMLDDAGWKLVQWVTLDETFELWYKRFLELIESKKAEIDARFGKNATNFTKGKYSLIYYALKNHWLGGCMVICSPKD